VLKLKRGKRFERFFEAFFGLLGDAEHQVRAYIFKACKTRIIDGFFGIFGTVQTSKQLKLGIVYALNSYAQTVKSARAELFKICRVGGGGVTFYTYFSVLGDSESTFGGVKQAAKTVCVKKRGRSAAEIYRINSIFRILLAIFLYFQNKP
jgi:hypothetical protein